MTRVFGWWDWDSGTELLVNEVTGEQVKRHGSVLVDSANEGTHWIRFDYQSADAAYPILVECAPELVYRKPFAVWRIDHVRSAALWRQEKNVDVVHPPYGLWRRVDDCITDALACWPETECVDLELAECIRAIGGWRNSLWREDFYRTLARVEEFKPLFEPVATRGADAWLMPLDTPAPSPWEFHDFPESGQFETAPAPDKFGTVWSEQILLRGLEKTEAQPFVSARPTRLKLPSSLPLSGLEGRIAHLQSRDGRRVLYPSRGMAIRRARIPAFSLTYADDDFLCSVWVSFCDIRPAPPPHWQVDFRGLEFGRRGDSTDADICAIRLGKSGEHVGSRRVWLSLYWALADGWLEWNATKDRHPWWLEGLRAHGLEPIRLCSAYRGGLPAVLGPPTQFQRQPLAEGDWN